ncbi:M42 family metallopeptidase [Crassaminicella thermophila]|uniref:M42 family metallopeptidase n=1 Tax=Crassaminicella thermophila TaxID=2599308 RepID=A0A5C0SG82_CRATE|nr:M42 family metallopeptidase [Crassaminicella thermophila]QEK13180.1 M42 family metallopeptidase [Crassaminicella thermophila]
MLLKKLTELPGVSGNEKEVRDFILSEIKPYVDEIKIDRLGNLIAVKKGKEGFPRIMLSAHMDEVGMMVKSIDDNGFIKFLPVGGMDDRIFVSKVVEIGKNRVKGVIGAKAIHLQEPDERNKALKHKQLYIDIGASSKAEAEKLVSKGDYITFASKYVEFGNNLVKAKALDDRAGCAIIMETLKKEYNSTIYAVFSVQEEVGLRGAGVAAYALNPDIAIVLEGTTCYDITDIKEPDYATRLGNGPALSIVDMVSYFDKNLVKKFVEIAKQHNIKIQFKQTIKGGNDAGKIHLTRDGIPTAAISIPCRYIHAPNSVMHKDDFENAIKLITLFLENVKKEEYINE